MAANLTYRQIERKVGETDRDGETHRVETVLEYGVEHDGVFVRIGTITEGQIEDARVRAQVEQDRGGDQSKSQPKSPSGAGA